MPHVIRNTATAAARWSAIALGFSLPVSTTLDSILVTVFVLACLAGGKFRELAVDLRSNPVGIASLALAGMMILGMIWSPSPVHMTRGATVDTLNFIMLPLFMTVFKDEPTRRRAINAFLSATVLILLISCLLWTGLVEHLPKIKGDAADPVAFKFHITHNFFMAIAVLFCIQRAEYSPARMKWFYYTLAAFAAFNVLFMIQGRTGQLALAAAILFYAYSRYRCRGITAIMVIGLIIAAITWFNPNSVMHQGTAKAWHEATEFQNGGIAREDSSIGLRLEFYRNTLKMIAHRPLLGIGTNGFKAGYAEEVAGTAMVPPNHPHNAFLLITAELGIAGLATLLALLTIQWVSARRMPHAIDMIRARTLLLIFVVGGLVSATFTDHAEGLFFVWVSGMLWSEIFAHKRG
jgi:O-antigen ligase